MRKLFLLSAFLIFACSSDSSSNEENTTTGQKKLVSFEIIEDDNLCVGGKNYSCIYENDKIITKSYQGYRSSCYSNNSDNWNYNNRYQTNYEYLSNKILVTSPEDEGEVNLDENGLAIGVQFLNGELISNGDITFAWEGGNVLQAEIENYSLLSIDYSSILNNTNFIHPLFVDTDLALSGEYIALIVSGAAGKTLTNLPLRTIKRNSNGEILSESMWSYVMDDENYPIYIKIDLATYENNEFDYGEDLPRRLITYKLTYTN